MSFERIDFKTGTFYQGDCFEVLATLTPGGVDMILNDPPYGTTQNKWDSVLPLPDMWAAYWRVLKANGPAVMTAAQPFTSALVMSQVERFKYDWVWEKSKATGHGNAKRQPMRAHECALVFYKEQCEYIPQMTSGAPYRGRKNFKDDRDKGHGWYGDHRNDNEGTRYPRSVQFFPNEYPQSIIHPTQKPVALFGYLIKTYTNPGELVLDPTAGSGTTAVAAIQAGRRWICVERDPEYFFKACARVYEAEAAL